MSFLAALRVDAPEAAEEEAPQVGGHAVTKAVIDTNAIVKGFRLERFAEEAVTIPEVLQEVKDKQARHVLATLPFELKVKEPDEEAVKVVRRFARLTGDLGALSTPDLKVIALAYMLERDAHGVAHIRTEPPPLTLSKHKNNKGTKQPGWDFVPNADDWAELDEMNEEAERAVNEMQAKLEAATLEAEAAEAAEAEARAAKVIADAAAKRVEVESQNTAAEEDDDGGEWTQNVCRTTRIRRAKREQRRREAEEAAKAEAEKAAVDAAAASARKAELDANADEAASFFTSAPQAIPEGAEDEAGEDEASGDRDEESEPAASASGVGGGPGWGESGDSESEGELEAFESTITCVTADYAMQNVILQMNMRLLTPDGMRITNLRRWVLRCHACGEITRQTTRVFCPKCGNNALQKVEHTVSADGVEQFGVRRKHILRGTRYSIPLPKGGRKEKAPILREDQLIGMRSARRKDDVDVFAAEYNEESFADGGRGAQPGTAHLYHQRDLVELHGTANLKKNPNERRFVRTNRRRK